MRVLVVTNFEPDERAPQRGQWVRDQIGEMRDRGLEVDVFSFSPGAGQYAPATFRLRRLLRRGRGFDVVHAHYGLPGWCALLAGARPLVVTFHGTDVRHPLVGPTSRLLARRVDLAAAVSRALFGPEDGRRGLPAVAGRAVLPCGPSLGRFRAVSREQARAELGLERGGRYLLFAADPARPEKRADRAERLAAACDAQMLRGGSIEPERMSTWINAANAVVVTSDYEGFGMVCLEALACRVPILSTPVGIAPFALEGVEGALCAPFDLGVWGEAAAALLDDPDARLAPSPVPALLSAERGAERTIEAYRDVIDLAR